jgi:acyl transferase domain-containing protein/NADPH:quinone reductase-like Zn-dependent oxidoreductase
VLEYEPVHDNYRVPGSEHPRRLFLLPFSAHNPDSLSANIFATHDMVRQLPLADVAYTLSARRSKFLHKAFSILDTKHTKEDITLSHTLQTNSASSKTPSIAFVFTGQGAQWQGMGAELMDFMHFNASISHQDDVLQSLSNAPTWKLEDVFTGRTQLDVQEAEVSQTLCSALQIALVDLLQSWGITPEACVGHSSGEIAAAYAAGYISAAEAIATAYCRGISIVTNTRKGAMLAVGLSIEATLQLFEGMESEVKIAAVNSPTSVTLSGDTDCINQLYEQLNSRDCFARKLWTGGNAYHSHHMNEVGREYGHMLLRVTSEHERTKQWISSKRCNKTRWISSVTPDKSEFFQGPSSAYWRSNLQLPVQFSKALGNLSSQGHLSPDIYIEIGPHSVLQSPIKEILAQAAEAGAGKPAIYLSTLTRNENGMQSILTLCGNLFCLNAAVDLGAANAHETLENGTIRRLPGSVCTDLPPYQYKYGSPVYHENRVFREIKQRKHLRHDILGVMQAGCAKERPSWRNILRIKDVPWLMDHELLPDIVFPGAGYVALAIEAVAQFLNKDPTVSMFKLRNISIKTAMRIPKDDMGLEIVLNMSASVHSSCWYQFNIASVYGTTWTEHASGLISMPSSHERSLPDLASHMDPRFVEASDWYRKFSQAGLGYGPSFQGLSDVLSDPSKNIASAKVCLNTTKGMFTGPESQYVVHPASLDICFQLAIIAAHGGHTATFKTAYIPVLIDEMTVWPTAGHQAFGRAVADARFKGLRGAHARIQLFAEDKRPMVEITNLRSVQYVGGNAAEQNLAGLPNPYTRLVWKPDITTLSCAQARSLFPATVPAVTISHTLNLMDMTSAYMIAELAEKYSGHRPENADLRRFLLWIKRTAASEEPLIQKACSMTTVDRVNALEQVRVTLENIVDVKHTMHIFDNIPDILAGRSTGVEVALQDDHLTELYTSGIGISAAYPQLGRVLDLLSHKNPSMKILEVGSGTGCATMIALNTLGGAEAEEKRYGEYVFTDISTRFLQPAQDRFVDFKDVAYRTLDFNRSPLSQGFTCDFDLIIASECLHTAEDVPQALRHVRELLKVGGHLLMLETTRTILGHGLAYGTFPSYWPMEEDKDSPFLTTEEWQRSLEQSGFSGIDLELDDYPAPFSIASTIMATALSTMSVDITVPASTVYIVSPSTEDLFGRTLASGLLDVGSRPIITSLDDADLPSGSRVILVTNIDAQPLIDNNESHFLRLKEVVSKSSSILFLTTGDIIRGTNPKASVVTGLVRMLTTEDSSSRYGVFHLEGDCDISDKALLKLVVDRESRLYAGDFEREIAVHNGVANICRLIVDRDLNERYRSIYSSPPAMIRRALHSAEPMSIGFETPGLLSTMYFKRDDTFDDPIPESWIEVQTKAIGLNWKDVAACSGKLDINYMSLEYAGVVTACGPRAQEFQIGDRVYGLALKKFGNVLRISARHARLMRPVDGFVEAATMPIVFCTAVYALLHLARLRRGESILIQSAAGGLGLAAIQIGRSVGAEIYVTTGTDTKTSYLAEKCDIDRMRIFSSRGVSDVGKMMQATKQKGFDVILSSSNGNTMQEVARCIARRGRFIDVGRVDVQNNNVMTMDFFERNASFSSFDLGKIIEEEPEFAAQ